MDGLTNAVSETKETLVILPLVLFCFIPVWQDRKDTALRLLCKIGASLAGMFGLMFLVYLCLPAEIVELVNVILCMGIFFWLYQKEVNVERSHLWFVFCTACLVGSISFLFIRVVDVFWHPSENINMEAGMDSVLVQFGFECLELLLLFYPVKKYLGWLVHEFYEEAVWRVFWILPCGFTFFSLYFIPYDNQVMKLKRFLPMYIAVLLVLLALIVFLYVLFYKVARSMVERQELFQKAAALELQAEQYHRLQAHVQETRRLRHDFRHQLVVISEMVKNQKYGELGSYLDEYVSGISDMPVAYSESSAVNAILNHYSVLCSEEGIPADFSIRLGGVPVEIENDFCVLLGNLLENAVEGCRRLPDGARRLSLKIEQTTPHILLVQATNPFSGEVRRNGKNFLSSKRSGEGQGLKSVQMIAKRHHGFADVSLVGGNFEVKALLTLP